MQHPGSPRRSNPSALGAGDSGEGSGDGDSGREAGSNWSEVVQGARNGLARFASPLASSRWQVWCTYIPGVSGVHTKYVLLILVLLIVLGIVSKYNGR